MPRRATSRRVVLPALSAVLILAALLVWGVPWWTKDRPVLTSTPTPPPFAAVAPIVLKPGETACESVVAFEPATRAATILTDKDVEDGPPLRVTATAPGYRSSATIPGGYGGLAGLRAELEAPAGDRIGEVCVRNEGRRRVVLQGTVEGRIQNRSETTVDGEPIPAKLALLLSEETDRSLADRPGEILDRMAAFKPPIVGSWSLALVALLILLGVPGLVVYAVARGIADEE